MKNFLKQMMSISIIGSILTLEVNVTHQASKTDIILNNKLLLKAENKKFNDICIRNKEFQNQQQELYLIQTNVPFKVKAFAEENSEVSITGISKSIYNQVSKKHQSEVIILGFCRNNNNNEVVQYKLMLNITSLQNNITQTLQPIPVTLFCITSRSYNKFEYVLLQFIITTFFVLTNIVFTKINTVTNRIDAFLLLLLAISIFHWILSFLFVYFSCLRIIYVLCKPQARNLIVRRFGFGVTFLFMIFFLIKTFQIQILWIHYFENLMTVLAIGSIIKVTRVRYLILLWLIVYFFYDTFARFTQNYRDYQFYFPALSRSKPYTCVNVNIMQLALPLTFSIFFLRFSERNSQNKNLYLMLHFMSYLTIGVFTSIFELRDSLVRSTVLLNINVILISGFGIAIMERKYRKLLQFRLN